MRFLCIQSLKQVFSVAFVAMAIAIANSALAGSETANAQSPIVIRLVDSSTASPVESATTGPKLDIAGPQLEPPPVAVAKPAVAQPTVAEPAIVKPTAAKPPVIEKVSAVANQPTLPSRLASPTAAPPDRAPVKLPLPLPPQQPSLSKSPPPQPISSGSPAKPSVSSAKPSAEIDKSSTTLKPIPATPSDGPVEIEAASLKNVTPGTTTQAELIKAWGEAKEMRRQNGVVHYLYSIPPFNRIEVIVVADKVASILIRLDKAFPVNTVAQQLELTKIRPVLILNDTGEILGQSYPERGVLLAFEPGSQPNKPSNNVIQIILESVTAESFVLRAETNLELRPELTRRDCEQAIKLQPTNARARWLLSRVFTLSAELDKAVASAREAVRLEPANAQYRVTLAQAIGQTGMTSEALREAERAAKDAAGRLHIKAQAHCLMGDLLASAAMPDYKEAMAQHLEAIRIADSLVDTQHPAIRLAAKEVQIDAHLGAANDIAWGKWNEKEKAIDRWLSQAVTLADELIQNDGGSDTYRFHVYNRAIAVCVGAQGLIDPLPWTEQALRQGRALISKTQDPIRKSQYQWDLGMALYDTLQVCQLRGEHDAAMKYGAMAVGYFEQSQQKRSAWGMYMLGRLYFRMGAVCALHDHDHRAAVRWFDKACPLLEKPLPTEAQADLGRHGETFVSMGVSYWEIGRKERGVELTERGVGLMEQAVKRGLLSSNSLTVAYTNLAIMHRKLGQLESAARFESLASKQKDKTFQR